MCVCFSALSLMCSPLVSSRSPALRFFAVDAFRSLALGMLQAPEASTSTETDSLASEGDEANLALVASSELAVGWLLPSGIEGVVFEDLFAAPALPRAPSAMQPEALLDPLAEMAAADNAELREQVERHEAQPFRVC